MKRNLVLSLSGIIVIVSTILIIINVYYSKSISSTSDQIIELVYKAVEESYFEGQKDALEGDIRIELNSDSCYIWSKSPWDGGSLETLRFNPICDKNDTIIYDKYVYKFSWDDTLKQTPLIFKIIE